MNFNFSNYDNDYQLYHVKYGRGAVVAAVPKSSEACLEKAKTFNRRDPSDFITEAPINHIKSIEENNDFVTIDFYQEVGKSEGSIITRVLPVSQITFEIY